ncbi:MULTISPECIES: response regulator [unclassified Granulicatella]|uniref:response regulator n=1 Tax=unclassified Granulicatella TaxID=2630493 RepID=UPI0010740ADF|nr:MULTISPECIES: response regulator [unclassified Granulicatella]MBF0780406.1 response regulator [Granulicatella sp. 19428wC4_WM01]TFU95444.1 response regulator [Granulicatella sp. WM01]
MNILIIEDDPMVAMIHQEFLKRMYEQGKMFHAKDLISAKSLLKKHKIDVILLDNYLPDGKGVQFLETIQCIPTIMITAANDVDSVKIALSYGIVDYLVKPFTFERFKKAFDRVKDYKKLFVHDKVSQEHLDNYFSAMQEDGQTDYLPKGLAKITLKKVVAALMKQQREFTTQQIADEVAISRITIKKYLNYLVDSGFLNEDAEYLTLGRPVSIYTILNREKLNQFVENQ